MTLLESVQRVLADVEAFNRSPAMLGARARAAANEAMARARRAVATFDRTVLALDPTALDRLRAAAGLPVEPAPATFAASSAGAPMSPARRRELLGCTETGQKILREEDAAALDNETMNTMRRAVGLPTKPAASSMSPARRRELLECTETGRAILRAEDAARRRI